MKKRSERSIKFVPMKSVQRIDGNLLKTYDDGITRAFRRLEPRDRDRAAQLGLTIGAFVEYRDNLRADYRTFLVWPRSQFRVPLRKFMVPGCDVTTPKAWLRKMGDAT